MDNTHTFKVPSGFEVTIREQNGADDDVLSNAKNAENGMSIVHFLHGIITNFSHLNRKPTLDEVKNLKIRDKYVIIIISRIFSIGQFVEFEYKWDDLTVPTKYVEDLSHFIWDYNNPFPEVGDKDYDTLRIQPYKNPADTVREFTTKSGKKLRYKYSNINSEIYLLAITSKGEYSVNKEILARELDQDINGSWVRVQNFASFSNSDMKDIRADIVDNDLALEAYTEIKHPDYPEKVHRLGLLNNPNFFFPART